jgi:putative ATP-binding cassette transporter
MKVPRLLLRSSPLRAYTALACAVARGVSAAVLIALTYQATRGRASSTEWIVTFGLVMLAQFCLTLTTHMQLSRVLQYSVLPSLRYRLASVFQSAPLRTLEEIGPARMEQALLSDLGNVAYATNNWREAVSSVSTIVACLVVMAWLSMTLLPWVLAEVAIGLLVFYLLSRGARRFSTQAQEAQERAMVRARGVVEGIKELKLDANARESFMSEAFVPDIVRVHERTSASGAAAAVAGAWAALILVAATGLLVFRRANNVAPSIVAAYAFALFYLQGIVLSLASTIPRLLAGEAALSSMDELIAMASPEHRSEHAASNVTPPWTSLELRGIEHSYRREGLSGSQSDFAFGPIDFVLRPREIVFVVGGNGSGKSTFAKLLTGLYVPRAGEIRVDGQPIDPLDPDRYRQMFTAVMSDCHVFDELYGLEGADLDAKANGYLEMLRLERKVRVEKGVFSTVKLSQGQRKRLALATAYLEGREVYVLDEWAAQQDPEFKEIFYQKLLPELKRRGKAAVVITHDERYFRHADRIVRFESGRIMTDRSPG